MGGPTPGGGRQVSVMPVSRGWRRMSPHTHTHANMVARRDIALTTNLRGRPAPTDAVSQSVVAVNGKRWVVFG